ncbi:type VI secretion system lipoprotein TssJ [Roseomonas sp. NAR14]|uniref:Type VI secretion system lipoprotein TssJ n=1 Tax=Roseomonas acroporae TaxID=2937791 RepID=A0A9X1Y765_9PROT|nr:type VI secretion system lipoprotein TssJ [Roseomonas acroporae]MCK8784375.1 type VI secretion system lipoprotein TssJ [Roseomonas acroporae]
MALIVLLGACGADPTRTSLQVNASPGVNPNSEEQPSPIVVRVYELKSVDTFNQLSFFDLYNEDAAKLGADLLNRRELEMQPGKSQAWERDADPAARFIGVVAAYRSLNGITWRASVPLEVEGRNRVLIQLDPLSLAVTKPRRSRFLGIF